MNDTNALGDPPSSTGATGTTLADLEQELQKLKKLVEAENKGLAGWAKRWGAILALLMAFFAVPRGVVDAYHVFWSRPKTELVPGSILVMGYDPMTRKVSFGVDFGAANSGTKDDFVKDLRGSLMNDSAPDAKTLPFGISEFECSSQGTKVSLPFPIRTSAPTSIACTIASQLGEPAAGPFAHSGSYRLAMSVGELSKESQTLDFCFFIDDKTLAEFFGSTKLESARFLYPDCKQGGGH